jgi:hypothetical protein
MNRLKKIFSSLSDIGIVPPSDAIRRAWGIVITALDAHAPVVAPEAQNEYALARKLIDRIVSAVAGIAEDAEKASTKATVTQ